MNKRPALRPDTPLDQALAEVARGMLTDARDVISDPALQTDAAIHDFRKAVKRWRSFLRLVEPHFGEGAANLRKTARDTARKLAGARDLKSTLDAVDDLRESAYELNDRSFDTIRTRIAAMQSAAEKRGVGAGDRAQIAQDVSGWLTTISLWPFKSVRFDEISDSLTNGYRRARAAMPENWREANDEELHEFRRRTIDHRYQLELLEPLWPRMAKIWVDEAQRLRDALGQHRDLALLQAMAGPHQPLARFRSKLLPAIARRQEAHLSRAAKIAARVFAEKPRAFQNRIEELWRAGNDKENGKE
jgi:CHAD domain-containing protein